MMAFRLCLAIGLPHPDWLWRLLTAKQWADWLAFSGVETWGDIRADLRAAIIGAHLSNRWRGKSETPVKPTDLMPHEKPHEQTPEEMEQRLKDILYAASRTA